MMQSKLVELLPESTGHNLIHRQDASDETRQFGSLIYMIFGQSRQSRTSEVKFTLHSSGWSFLNSI